MALVNRAKVKKFKADKEGALAADEARDVIVKTFEQEMGTTLAQMEERIENLEKQIPGSNRYQKGRGVILSSRLKRDISRERKTGRTPGQGYREFLPVPVRPLQ